jgi:hypothetical protein
MRSRTSVGATPRAKPPLVIPRTNALRLSRRERLFTRAPRLLFRGANSAKLNERARNPYALCPRLFREVVALTLRFITGTGVMDSGLARARMRSRPGMTNFKSSSRRLDNIPIGSYTHAILFTRGRFSRASCEVEQGLRCPARVLRKHSPGGRGLPSDPTTGVCRSCRLDEGQARAGETRKEPRPRKNAPPATNPATERREALPRPLFPALPDTRCGRTTKARLAALRLPSLLRGEN